MSARTKPNVETSEQPYPPIVHTLLAMSGQDEIVIVRRSFVHLTGSLESGMMLNQLLYWQGRGARADGLLWKSDADWMEELCLSRHGVRNARARLERLGLIQTRVMRANGSPTTHYKCDLKRLEELWKSFLGVERKRWQAWLDGLDNAKTGTYKHSIINFPV
jgi:hypothetical protein